MGNRLIDLIEDCFLHQMMHDSTRGDDIPDLVLSTDRNLISFFEVDEKLGNSSLNIIRFTVYIWILKIAT